MDALKAAVWVSKLEDQRDALRLRLHTMGIKALFNKDLQDIVKPKQLSLKTLPAYFKRKILSGLLSLASITTLFSPTSFLGRLFLVILFVISTGLLLIAIISGSIYYYLSQPVDETQRQYYLKQHQQKIALTLHDDNNDLIGAFPPPTNHNDDARGALFVKTVPPVFWALIKAPADRDLSFTPQQTHFWTLYKKIIQFKDATYKGVNLTAPYQANQYYSLLQHIASGLQAEPSQNGQEKGFIASFTNSKETLRIARHLFPYLAQNNGEAFKRWSAMHAPSLSAKDDVYGLTAISATLFGRKVASLTAGQQALLATAYHQQVAMALLFSSKAKIRQATWTRLIKQTQIAATQYYEKSQPQMLQRIMDNLKSMQSVPALAMSSSWLDFLNNVPQSKQDYRHLLQRSHLILGKLKSNLYQKIQNTTSEQAKDISLTGIKISLPLIQNQQLASALDEAFSTLQRFYPTLFSKQLGQSIDKKGALISIQIANERGNIIRSYQRGSVSPRPISNLSEIAMSSLLLAKRDSPKTRYCNKAYAGIRNATEPNREGISNCKALSRKGHSFHLQDSIQQGKTLPLLYALTEKHAFSATTLATLYKDFGFFPDTMTDSKPNAKVLAYELSVGAVQSNVENIHQLIHRLNRQLYGIPYANNPSLIQTLQLNLQTETGIKSFTQQSSSDKSNNFQLYFSDSRSRRYMKTLFAIPSHKKHNPLKFLRSVEKKYGVDFLLVKSATSNVPNGNIRDKWLIGSLRLKQHIYSFVIMIGSDDMNTGLGKNISHQQLMLPIMNALIESLD